MKTLFILTILACTLTACATAQPPAECSGTVRKVNQQAILSSIACPAKGAQHV